MSRKLVLLVVILLPFSAFGGHGRRSPSSTRTTHTSWAHRSGHNSARPHKIHTPRGSTRCVGCARDRHGHIRRSESAKHNFMRQTGYPHGRKGYVVDHIRPLECGGSDTPSNMQWQTIAAAKAKDRTEAKCR